MTCISAFLCFCVSAFPSVASSLSGSVAKGVQVPALGFWAEAFLFAFFVLLLGFAAIYFGDGATRVSVRCACGRRELKDVVCTSSTDRTRLADQLTANCPWCRGATAVSAVGWSHQPGRPR